MCVGKSNSTIGVISKIRDIVNSCPVECNLYSYAGNNPVNFVDPTGMCAEPATAAACAGAVIVASGAAAYGIGKGALWAGNKLGLIGNKDYQAQTRALDQGASQAWNTVYKRVGEVSLPLAGTLGFSLHATKGVFNAASGRDSLHLSNSSSGLHFGEKKLDFAQRVGEIGGVMLSGSLNPLIKESGKAEGFLIWSLDTLGGEIRNNYLDESKVE